VLAIQYDRDTLRSGLPRFGCPSFRHRPSVFLTDSSAAGFVFRRWNLSLRSGWNTESMRNETTAERRSEYNRCRIGRKTTRNAAEPKAEGAKMHPSVAACNARRRYRTVQTGVLLAETGTTNGRTGTRTARTDHHLPALFREKADIRPLRARHDRDKRNNATKRGGLQKWLNPRGSRDDHPPVPASHSHACTAQPVAGNSDRHPRRQRQTPVRPPRVAAVAPSPGSHTGAFAICRRDVQTKRPHC